MCWESLLHVVTSKENRNVVCKMCSRTRLTKAKKEFQFSTEKVNFCGWWRNWYSDWPKTAIPETTKKYESSLKSVQSLKEMQEKLIWGIKQSFVVDLEWTEETRSQKKWKRMFLMPWSREWRICPAAVITTPICWLSFNYPPNLSRGPGATLRYQRAICFHR